MKARIEKKLSKRLVTEAPSLFNHAWIDREPTEAAYAQGTSVSGCYSVGGEYDSYSGDSTEVITAWASWLLSWKWNGDFQPYPPGHRFQHLPDTGTFKPTTSNLLKLARDLHAQGGREHE